MVTFLPALILAALSVTARADRRSVDVGDEVQVEVRASGASFARLAVQAPRAPPGLEIGRVGDPKVVRTVLVVNGRPTQSETMVWQFDVTPTHAGRFTVPAFVVANGAETASSQPFTLDATGTFEPQKFAFVETRVDPRPRYVGEPITVDLVAGLSNEWVDRLVEGETSLNAPWITDGLGNGALAEPEGVPAANAPGAVMMRTPSQQGVSMKPGHEARGASAWATWMLRRSFVPTRPGPVTIGPTSFRAVIATRIEHDAIFTDRIFASETKLAAVDAPTIAIDVKPLPDAGRPDDFGGLVGRLQLEVDANPKQVKVGETVRVTVRLSGDGNVASTPLPKTDVPGFKRFGAVEDVDVSEEFPSRTLTYDLAPVSTDVTTIPAFKVPVFDTSTGTYRTLASTPIRLQVLPGARVAAIQDASPSPTEPHHDAAPSPSPESGATWASVAHGFAPWMAIVAIPPVLAAAWLVARRRQRGDAPKPARRSIARRRLSDALSGRPRATRDGAAAIAQAMGRFLADLTEKPPETFVGADFDAALAPFVADRALRRQVEALVADAEAIAFGGRTGDLAALAARAEALAPRLEAATKS